MPTINEARNRLGKVLFLEPIGELGGAERCLLDLMHALRCAEPGLELSMICGTDGPLIEESARLGVFTKVLVMPQELQSFGDSGFLELFSKEGVWRQTRHMVMALLQVRLYAQELASAVTDIKPDLVHSNGIKFHVLSRLAHLRETPTIFHLRDFIRSRRLALPALQWASGAADHIVAISRAVQEECNELLRVETSVIYDAIDVNQYGLNDGPVANLDELAGMPERASGTIAIGLVATYARWKGHELFLQAAASLRQLDPDTPRRYYIVGGPIYRTAGSQVSSSELRQKAQALGIDAEVGFIGFQSDAAAVYRALDIVVHASTRPEPFGRTIVEAMACGKPVIVSAAGGAAELFTDGIDALGVAPNNVQALADAIGRLTKNPDERRQLGQQARKTVSERFCRERLGPEMMAVYRMVCQKKHKSAGN